MTLSRVGGRSGKWDRDRNKHQQPKNGTPSCIPMFSRLERGFGQKGVRGWDLAREAVFLETTQQAMTGLPMTKTYLQTKSMHSTRHSLFTEVRLALSLRTYPSHLHRPPTPYVPSYASIRRETIPSQSSGS